MSDKQRVSIADLRDHVGETVELRGWLYNQRSSGRISFLLVRDGSGIAQCVLVEKEVGPDTWSAHQRLTQESSLIVRGKVREDARAPGGYELALSDVQPVQIAEDYPIGPKEHGIDFLLNNRHLWLRSSRPWHIMRIRDEVIFGIREFFRDRGFVCLDSPILTRAIGEEAGTLFETEYFDLGNASLAQTGQLYVEAGAMAHGKVYCFGPTFRAEKSKTRRHLTEFWMLEPEMAWYDWQDNMALQEELTSTENKVGFARQAYNDSVMEYNTKRESFPDNVFAGMFGFQGAELLQSTESAEERKAPKVSFT